MNYRLLFAILSTAFVEQTVITIVRVTTTYRALELDLSVVWIGVVTAAYAVLPIGFGIPMGRFIDRDHDHESGPSRGPWQHPQVPRRVVASDVTPGERFVDREFFDDGASQGVDEGMGLRRGSRVVHAQFGEGEVRSVVQSSEPAVLVAFPGRGEKKILARFLRLP